METLSPQGTVILFVVAKGTALGYGKNKVFHFSGVNEQLQCWDSLPLSCLLSRLVFALVSTLHQVTNWEKMVPPHGHPVTHGLLESHFHLQLKSLAFLPGRKHGRKRHPQHSRLPTNVHCSLMGSTRSGLRLRIASPGANLIK